MTTPATALTPAAIGTPGGPAGSYTSLPSGSPTTVEEIKAQGEISHKTGMLWLVGIVSVLMVGGGVGVMIWRPENTKDVWVIIGPIVTGIVSNAISAVGGERQRT